MISGLQIRAARAFWPLSSQHFQLLKRRNADQMNGSGSGKDTPFDDVQKFKRAGLNTSSPRSVMSSEQLKILEDARIELQKQLISIADSIAKGFN